MAVYRVTNSISFGSGEGLFPKEACRRSGNTDGTAAEGDDRRGPRWAAIRKPRYCL